MMMAVYLKIKGRRVLQAIFDHSASAEIAKGFGPDVEVLPWEPFDDHSIYSDLSMLADFDRENCEARGGAVDAGLALACRIVSDRADRDWLNDPLYRKIVDEWLAREDGVQGTGQS